MRLESPTVSVIVVSWNRKADTIAALESIQHQTYRDFETIVVDNASEDGSPEAILERWPDTKMFRQSQNLGAPGGRNAGIVEASGRVLFFLDSDAIAPPEALEKIVARLEGDPGLGIVGCQIIDYRTGDLDAACWVYPQEPAVWREKEFESYTFLVGGAAIRAEVFERCGLFWSDLFFARDEEDIALRAINKGYRIIHFPEVKVLHKTSPLARTKTQRKIELDLRNSLWLAWRYFPWPAAIGLSLARTLVYGYKGVMAGSPLAGPRGLVGALLGCKRPLTAREPLSPAALRRYRQLNTRASRVTW